MYSNIECNNKHKKVLIPDKIHTKLEMLSKIALFGSVSAILSFSGCTATTQQVEKNEVTTPTTAYSTTTRRPTTTEPITQPTTETATETTTEITTKPTTETTTTRVTTTEAVTTEEEPETTEEYTKEEKSKLTELSHRLDSICDKKGFTGEVKLLLDDILNSLYKNYPTWQNGYDDMPNTVEFIKTNLLDVLENSVYEIDFVDADSSEGKQLLNEGLPVGYTKIDGENLIIRIITKKKENANKDERSYSVQELLHEITHCIQKKILFNSNYFNRHDSMAKVFTEGFATFIQQFANPYSTDVLGSWSILNEDGTKVLIM